jgi:ferredoxin-NADP reductase
MYHQTCKEICLNLYKLLPMALLPWKKAVITKVTDETANTRRFCFETEEQDAFDFVPGQFITLDLPIHERRSKRMRSYSIASPPYVTNHFELVIVLMEGGAGTSYLFEQGKVGLEVTYRGPLGTFVLPEQIERDICMVCTGTGIAPFRSQLQHIRKAGLPHQQLHLVFGTRTRGDILYHREMEELALEWSDFHLHIALSREKPDNWEGHIGYVHDLYRHICGAGEKDMDFYLCGWKNMVDDARANLQEWGYPSNRVHLELYG